ncbi:MAG: hypothetical protein A2X81_12715 [Desulfobacterales bacterium GWB2_56_26]|nr:MAG: hypothetical protein A2X81_12715 [Desulfobacterales bacterium GWB2_56_26]
MKHPAHQVGTLLIALLLVLTVRSALADQNLAVEFEGLIEPCEMVNVGTPVQGVVDSINVQRSNTVKKGEPLVLLEASVENATMERARAMATGKGELELEKEKLAFALRSLARAEAAGDALSAEEREQAASEVALARARLQKAEENQVLARLDLARARALLDQRTIKSPISGIVVDRFIAPGEFVDDQPLLRLAQLDPLRVEVILPAEKFKEIAAGMKAQVRPEDGEGMTYLSTVVIVDKIIDPASGTFAVRLELPNPDYRVPSGLKCAVRFVGEDEAAKPAETLADEPTRKSRIVVNPILATSIH